MTDLAHAVRARTQAFESSIDVVERRFNGADALVREFGHAAKLPGPWPPLTLRAGRGRLTCPPPFVPGIAATTLASTSAPTTMSTMTSPGTLGAGTASISCAKRSQRIRPSTMPTGTPIDDADRDGDTRLPRHGRRQLTTNESKGLQQREFAATPTHRGDQRQGEGGDGPQCESAAEDRRASCPSIGSSRSPPVEGARPILPPGLGSLGIRFSSWIIW